MDPHGPLAHAGALESGTIPGTWASTSQTPSPRSLRDSPSRRSSRCRLEAPAFTERALFGPENAAYFPYPPEGGATIHLQQKSLGGATLTGARLASAQP
jgi:hypothetical protein